MSFSFSDLHPSLRRAVADLGFTQPTPIQSSAIPPARDGRDVLGCAMTGSGKTAAFLLPIMERLLAKQRGTTRALVLAPTRELAAQIVEQFRDLAKHTNLRAAAVFGGAGMGPQERAFKQGVDVIVACPGRLLDHLDKAVGAGNYVIGLSADHGVAEIPEQVGAGRVASKTVIEALQKVLVPALGLAFALERFDRRFKRVEDIARGYGTALLAAPGEPPTDASGEKGPLARS